MDYLKKAIEAANLFGQNEEGTFGDLALVYAAIAQAEAMQLIAKRLEQWMSAQGVEPEIIEAAERGIRYAKENQRLLRRIAVLEGECVESEFTGEEI